MVIESDNGAGCNWHPKYFHTFKKELKKMAGKKRFLVAIDGSAESKSVVQYISRMLSPVETEIVLFHVLNKVPESYWDFGKGVEADVLSKKIKQQVEDHTTAIKAFMVDSKQLLMDANFREENTFVLIRDRITGIARDIIVEAQRGYDGLIMGVAGTGKMKGAAVGSVSTKIIGALSTIPICIVAGTPAGKNVMLALDGSAGSMRALDYTCSLLNGFKGKVILFHALRHVGYPDPATGQLSAFEELERVLWNDIRNMLKPTLTEAKQRLRKAGRQEDAVITKFVTGVSSRAGALIQEAENAGCNSIIVGRTGISQVEDFNIGRVANKVVQGARNQAVWIIP
ncbi:MAG: universal stress protein [Desulfobacteraceae bacterium]|nr:MAG: universal stress protein [Desulfobacteraceae bacterium]